MNNENRLSKGLSGIAGEYFVAAELSRRGFMASITLRNNDSVDIHASDFVREKIFAIQVKTNQLGGRSWVLNKKLEGKFNKNFFYILVSLKNELERPDFFIVPSRVVSDFIKNSHSVWLKKLGRKGQLHNDSSMRKFDDKERFYLEKWELLS